MEYAPLLRRLVSGEHLSEAESAELIGAIMDGAFTTIQGSGLLVALASKGEHVDEIVGAARAMRDRSLRVAHGLDEVVDVVGTGGDGANTINVSTMAALVAAAAGIPVAKHGNRAASSACGSADVLEATGLSMDLAPERAVVMLRKSNFAFMFAPRYHPAMKNVAPIRRELGIKTIFNVLGPLTNPALATVQVVGVARESLLEIMGDVLRGLGVRRGAIVHGYNGIDEVAGDGPTAVYSFDASGARRWTIDPSEFGIDTPLAAIVGGSVDACREAFLSILSGERSPRAEVVALNAALVLYTAGVEPALRSALDRAREVLASGEALATYERAKEYAIHD
ncbi:MAG TPA: anthranilate phosphoribosyltransferase [Candidatus Baltobacteraceae bacterium]|jgi:anthranilate phosphoribosyltransferase|nr:anthranilate phosphoribosyltransferase [Candidatus Baltobacteraceae bacterium]